ncbi:MAG: spore maturation protein [Bacillota bacterium]
MLAIINKISLWIMPVLILLILSYGYYKNIKLYDTFTSGATEGIKIVFKILPYLMAMIIAINIFEASGVMGYMIKLFKPIFDNLNIPDQVIPLLFLRPLSGSGSLSYINKLMRQYGPDSFIGKMASTIQGSTETTFYIIAIYFGAVGIKKYRYSLIVGILADIAGFFAAVFICNLLFG